MSERKSTMYYHQNEENKPKGFWKAAFGDGQWKWTLGAMMLLPFSIGLLHNFETQYIEDTAGVELTLTELWFGRVCMFMLIYMCLYWLFDPIIRIRVLLPLFADLIRGGKILFCSVISLLIVGVVVGLVYQKHELVLGYVALVTVAVALLKLRGRLLSNRMQDLRSCSLDDIDIP